MARTLFKTIAEIRQFINIDVSQREATIMPHMQQAHSYISRVIGDVQFNALLNYYQVGAQSDSALDMLLPYAQLALANFGYMIAVPKLSVVIGDSGIGVISNEKLAPASKDKINDLINSLKADGYNALEDLLLFIEANQSSYPSASAFIWGSRLFVNSATELNGCIYTSIKHFEFIELKKFIFQVENAQILPILTRPVYNEIRAEVEQGTLSPEHEDWLYHYIRPAECYLAMNQITPNKIFFDEGNRLIACLQQEVNTPASLLYENVGGGIYVANNF